MFLNVANVNEVAAPIFDWISTRMGQSDAQSNECRPHLGGRQHAVSTWLPGTPDSDDRSFIPGAVGPGLAS